MATFYEGFVYETGVSAPLTIEGMPRDFGPGESPDAAARRYIDEVLRPARDKIRAEHLGILNRGVSAWNEWRRHNPAIRPTLANTSLAELKSTNLAGYDFSYTNLCQAQWPGVNLVQASFHQAILAAADLSGAHLEGANFCRTDLYETNLAGAWLTGANLQGVQFARTRLAGAYVGGCTVYGLSAWDLRDTPANESGLRIRYTSFTEQNSRPDTDQPDSSEVMKEVEVDGLDLASFMYLTLNNRNIPRVIDRASAKWVLLLGRFNPSKDILHAMEKELKRLRYIPIIFDFPPPERRDLIETLLLLAGLSAFVVVEMTDPRSTPLEVQAVVPNFGVPVLPIIRGNNDMPAMMSGLRKFKWVNAPIRYEDERDLTRKLSAWVKTSAEEEKERLKKWKNEWQPPHFSKAADRIAEARS